MNCVSRMRANGIARSKIRYDKVKASKLIQLHPLFSDLSALYDVLSINSGFYY